MADLSITATSVVAGSDSVGENGFLGATVTAGQLVYKDSADGLWKLVDANSATAAARTPGGIALNGGVSGQPVRVHKSGDLTLNAVLTVNTAYFLSDTPGGICPAADVGSGEYGTFVGIAKSTTVLKVNLTSSGVAS